MEQFEQYSVREFSIRGAEFLIRVEGMSMFPRYTNGDILAVKRLSSVTFFQWGCVYVLDTEQGMLIKRLFKSSNPSLSAQVIVFQYICICVHDFVNENKIECVIMKHFPRN